MISALKSSNNTTVSRELITNFQEKLAIIQKMEIFRNPLIIWQENRDKVFESYGTLKFVNEWNGNLSLRPLGIENPFKYKRRYKVALQNENGNILMETEVGNVSRPRYLSLKMPEEILFKNLRKSDRFQTTNGTTTHFTNINTFNYSVRSSKIGANVVNISETGICFKTNNPFIYYFQNNDRIIFNSFNDFVLREKFLGTIKFLKNFPQKEESDQYMVGVEFDNPIGIDDIFEFFDVVKPPVNQHGHRVF